VKACVKTLLTAGGSPSCWQRQVERNVAGLHTLWRACAWVDMFVQVQPKLSDQPLLGHCLVALTTRSAQHASAKRVISRQPRPGSTGLMESSKHERRPAGSGGSKGRRSLESWADFSQEQSPPAIATGTSLVAQPAHSAGEAWTERVKQHFTGLSQHTDRLLHRLPQVDQEANRALLYRLAGVSLPVDGADRPPHSATALVSERQQQYNSAALQARMQQEGMLPQLWLDTLIRRVRHVLNYAYPSTKVQSKQGEARLAQQWSTPIGEPGAPLELLVRLAEPVQLEGATSSGSERDSSAPPAPFEQPKDLSAAAVSKSRDPGNNSNVSGPAQSRNSLLQQLQEGSKNPLQDVVAMAQATGAQAEQIAPPIIAAQLPTLSTAQGIAAPAFPVAAATVKLGARAEMTLEDDLDMLAAKIKRILDDEARRHGIDV
jgi:hypothetical protein